MKKLIALTLATVLIIFAYGCVKEKHLTLNDLPPTVMVDGKLYTDTNTEAHPKEYKADGKINTEVPQTETPKENNQSNFGTGYDYHFREDGSLEINIDGRWYIFKPEISNEVITLKIVDKDQDNNLILAGKKAHEVFSLNAKDVKIYLDNKEADPSVLNKGMEVDITYGGYILETFPSMLDSVSKIEISSEHNENKESFSFADLYLNVLKDIYQKDEGLNEGAKYVSIDLSKAPGDLTDGEKEAIAWLFSCSVNKSVLTLSYNELLKQGYLSKIDGFDNAYEWKDGILLSITASNQAEPFTSNIVSFDVKKWRSPRGSYMFNNCTAVIPSSILASIEVEYEIGSEAIS